MQGGKYFGAIKEASIKDVHSTGSLGLGEGVSQKQKTADGGERQRLARLQNDFNGLPHGFSCIFCKFYWFSDTHSCSRNDVQIYLKVNARYKH